MAFINTVVARAAAGIWGLKLGYATTQAVLGQFNANGGNLDAIINNAFNISYNGVSNAAVAAVVVGNLGLTGAAATEANAYLVAQMNAVPATQRGAVLTNALNLFSGLGTNAAFGAAANDFNAKVAAAAAYSGTVGTPDAALGNLPSATSFFMLTSQDNITATAGNDTINAYIFDNGNTLQSGDFVDGGAGSDMLYADMGSSAAFSVTPITRNVESFAVRAQARPNESGDNNVAAAGRVNIDAERMSGVNRFESNNSRADLIIEDVRIGASQITRDVTIAFVQSDPGNVDFGVYFDQASLRANSNSSSSLTLQVIDVRAASVAATQATPLLDSPYDGISFSLNGQLVFLSSPAIGNALTYPALIAAIQAQLALNVLTAGVVTASAGPTFTVNDSQTGLPATGTSIILSANNAVFGIGNYIASQGVPANSNLFTQQLAGTSNTNDLVTSTIILDDVGRGSNGGDLVIGGLSIGDTSDSRGVDRFEITVERTSRLQNIDSTNNFLKEVVLKNGTVGGNVSVIGNVTTNGTPAGAIGAGNGQANALPGAVGQHDDFGFNDVRLIDASAMRGTVTFDAAITAASFGKYVRTTDTQANPAGDNTSTPGQTTQVADFIYTGGSNSDRMTVVIDAGIAGSRNTIMSGREDFTFNLAGGAGNDEILVAVGTPGVALVVPPAVQPGVLPAAATAPGATPLTGGFQNWYQNQKLNANIRIDGGDGNDTIRTPGAGDKIIAGGTGTDTIYVDNTGRQTYNQGSENDAGRVYSTAALAELAAATTARLNANATSAATLLGDIGDLDTLNLATPVSFNDPTAPAALNPALPTKANLETAILAAYTAQAITADQVVALINAYGTRQAGTVVAPSTTVGTAAGFTFGAAPVSPTFTLAEAGQFAAGNTLLDTYISATRAAATAATAADASVATNNALLNATQLAVVNASEVVNRVADGFGSPAGTAAILAGLNALNGSLVIGATAAALTAALNASVANGSRTLAEAQALETAYGGAGGIVDNATELAAIQAILVPAINTATNNNTTATATLAAAVTADNAAIRTAAGIVGAEPVEAIGSAVPGDSVGRIETAAAATAAANAVTAFTSAVGAGTLTTETAKQAGLAALKTALAVGITDLQAQILVANALSSNFITGGESTALLTIINAAPGVLTAVEKVGAGLAPTATSGLDLVVTAAQVPTDTAVATAQANLATLQAIATATAFARDQAAAAALNFAGVASPTESNAVWVLNTSNQQAVTTTPGAGYVLAVNDERNIFDLRSDVNDSYNLSGTRLTVTYKDLTSTVTVPSTNFRTSDLQINQAIKDAINNNAVLNKLIVAADGPANSLIITSLIDGAQALTNFAVTIAVPVTGALSPADIAAAATAYGVASNEGAVLAAMATAKAAFDTKGDYIDQWAETGAVGGNSNIFGANSVTTSDSTITGGADNDVIVLGTTTGPEALLSSNDTVVFGSAFGNDTVVYFRAGALATGGDVLNFAALGGTTLSTAFNVNRSVNVANEVAATNGTAALVAGLFVDSATAQTHVYVAVDTATNIGKVYAVVDAVGTGAGSVSATLAGTIDLADTLWSTLTTENFGG